MKSRFATSLRWILPCASRGQLSHLLAGGFALVTWLFGLVSVFGLLSWLGLGACAFGPMPRGADSEWEWTPLGLLVCGMPEWRPPSWRRLWPPLCLPQLWPAPCPP